MKKTKPSMFFLVGANGVGKSTLYETTIKPSINAPLINADVIQKEEMSDKSDKGSYKAARIADGRRQEHIRDKKSFVTESVFSHPSKLDVIRDAKEQGFNTYVYHVGVDYAGLSVERVKGRVKEGGHNVPENKIRERFERNKPLIKEALQLADKGLVYDNSKRGEKPRLIMRFEKGKVTEISKNVPKWTRDMYQQELEPYSLRVQSPSAASYKEINEISKKQGNKDTKLTLPKPGNVYVGKIIGETDLQYLQKGKNNVNIPHFKNTLDTTLKQQAEVAILYTQKNKALTVGLSKKNGERLNAEDIQTSLEQKGISNKVAGSLSNKIDKSMQLTEVKKNSKARPNGKSEEIENNEPER